MKRNAVPAFRLCAASLTLLDLKNLPETCFASRDICRLSYSLVTRMYQLPMLISVRMSSVPRDTQSPAAIVWPRLYGFSTVSLFDTGAGAIGAGAEASAAAGTTGAEAASGSEAAWAIAV